MNLPLDFDTVSHLILVPERSERMENMLTVTDVSRRLGLSTRMLRYYEEQGLIESGRLEGYAYRVYDEEAVCR